MKSHWKDKPHLAKPGLLGLGLALLVVFFLAPAAHAGVLDASWTAPTTNADGSPLTDLASYRLYYGTSNPVTCPGGATFVTVASPATSYRLTGLQAGTTYYVGVTAVDTSGNESACSNQASAAARIAFSVTPSTTVNFGTIDVGSTSDQTFTVQNVAGGTVSGTATTSALFSIVSGNPFNLVGLNATQTVTVRFTPTTSGTAVGNVNLTADGDTISRGVTGTGNGVSLVSLTADLSAPQPAGTTINFTATASGGTAPYQFRWYAFTGTTWTDPASWTLLRDWGSGSLAWTPTQAYPQAHAAVWVRSAGNTNNAPEATGVLPFAITAARVTSLTADRSAPQPAGTTINFTATASGGTAPYQFRWYAFTGTTWTDPASWTLLRDWGSGSLAWTPTQAYPQAHAAVWVRSAGNTNNAPEATGVLPFAITASASARVTSLTADRSAPQPAGTTINFTATASGGTAPYQFRWYAFTGTTWTDPASWTLLRDWGSGSLAWTPTQAYPQAHAAVWVRSAGNTNNAPEATGVLPFAITP